MKTGERYEEGIDYISLTDMLKAKDGVFFYFRLAKKPQYG
jgi:hypothetical protein